MHVVRRGIDLFCLVLPVVIAVAACKGGSFLTTSDTSSPKPANEPANEAVVDLATGVTSKQVGPDATETQTIDAGAGTEIEGSSVAFPPGSLALETTVSIEAGAEIAGAGIAEELGLTDDVSLEPTGVALVVTNDANVNATQPFTLAIALPSNSLNLISGSNYVVVYRVFDASTGEYLAGLIPTPSLTIESGKVTFSTIYFGSFQIAKASSPITEAKEVKSATPYLSKKAEAALSAPSWSVPVATTTSDRRISVKATLADAAIERCVLIADGDQLPPWDFVSARLGLPAGSVSVSSALFEGKARFECIDAKGRVLTSEWSNTVTIAATSVPDPKPSPSPSPSSSPSVSPSPTPSSTPTNAPPTFAFTSPVGPSSAKVGDWVTFQWTAADPDDNAEITFYQGTTGSGPCNASGTLHSSGIFEDDGSFDVFLQIANTAHAGNLFLCAEISDGVNPVQSVWSQPFVIQICTWKVTAADNAWDNVANWAYCSGGFPGETDYVVVPGGATNNPLVAGDLTILGIGRGVGGGTIKIADATTLTLDDQQGKARIRSDITIEGATTSCSDCVFRAAPGLALDVLSDATLQLGKGLNLKVDFLLRVGSLSFAEAGHLKSMALSGANDTEWPVITTDEPSGFTGIIVEGIAGKPSSLDLSGIKILNVAPSVPAFRIVDHSVIETFDSVWIDFIGPNAANALRFRRHDQNATECLGIAVQDASWDGLRFEDYLSTNIDAGVCDIGAANTFTIGADADGSGSDAIAENDPWNRVAWDQATTSGLCVWTNTSTDEQWNNSANWDCGRVPTENDFVEIPSGDPARVSSSTNYIRGFGPGSGNGLVSIEAGSDLYVLSEKSTFQSSVTIEGTSLCTTCRLHAVGSATVRNDATLTFGPNLIVKVGHALGDRFNVGIPGSEPGHLSTYSGGPTFLKGDNFQQGHGWGGILVGGGPADDRAVLWINGMQIHETKETAPSLKITVNTIVNQLDNLSFDTDSGNADAFAIIVESCDIVDTSWDNLNFVDSIIFPLESWRGNIDISACTNPPLGITVAAFTGAGGGVAFAKDPNGVLIWSPP